MTEQQIGRDQLRALANAATSGPWERGNWYHVQESTHCTCSQYHGPLVGIDPHGVLGEMHVHRYSDAPLWREGIRARDDATGGVDVVIESDEYGTMSDADAEFIAAAREAVPQLLDQLDQAEAERDEYDPILARCSEILTGVANALNGPPPPLISWSHHDLAEKAAEMVARAEGAEARIKAVRAVVDSDAAGPGEEPLIHVSHIRRALDGDAQP